MPAAINYKYADTNSVSVTTGSGADTVNVRATGVTTNLSTSGGLDVVNVGNAGSVQGILGALNVQNPPSHDTINVNDSADATARTVTLSTFTSGGSPWGSITGLAPAAINYKYADTNSVSVTTGSGADTVNVRATGVTTNLSTSGGLDVVNVGNAGSVQGILGALNVQNPPSHDTINVNDSADATARTVTLSTFTSGGSPWGSITGLAPAAINYKYADTNSVSVTTGSGADTVNVRATGVTTNLSTSGGLDVVNVGNAGSVQGILGALNVQNPPSHDTINVNDSADATARTVTLSTFTSGGSPWGSITGLSPAAINYKYADTNSVSVTTGSGADTVNVRATGVTTNLSTSGGLDVVNVGNAGSVQGILGALNVQNPPSHDTINVNDSADATARTVTLSTFTSGGSPWGSITGLAPAAINYKYADTNSVSVTTGSGADTVNVRATGVTTNLSTSGGLDVVNVGNAGSVQGILGALNVQNPPSHDTINVNDSADATARTVTLSTFTSGGSPWGSITGLVPAAINYKYADTNSVSVTTGSGADTVNVRATGVTTNLSTSGGLDVVNVGNAGSVQGILGALNVQNPPSHDTINVNDSADATARTVTLSTFTSGGSPWGSITGLAPAAINYKYADTNSVSVTTGSGADTVNVRATGVTTNLSTSGGLDVVNVGNAGSVQGILGALNVQNPPSHDTINVNDSADATARTVTLSTFTSGGSPWGSITGLAPAAINYKYADTNSVSVTTGSGADTVNVRATGVTTNLSTSGGLDVVNVGNAGSVQGILGALNVQNPPSHDTINVNDSADATARTVTLSTFTSGGSPWGSITGLSPAAINYKYADTNSVSVTTGSGADTVNVRATGVTTNLSTSGGLDVVNVGNAGSVQGILGALNVQNPPSHDTINVNDSADATARTVTLSTFTSGGSPWGSITGLAPAAINYKYADTNSVSVTTGSGADTVNVRATGVTTNLSTSGGLDVVNVGNAGSVQGILGALNVQNPPSHDTINVNDSADATARTVTLSTFTSGGSPWGSITGLCRRRSTTSTPTPAAYPSRRAAAPTRSTCGPPA